MLLAKRGVQYHAMHRRLWEAIIAVAIEESVRAFMPFLLPYVWVAILLGLTAEVATSKAATQTRRTIYENATGTWRYILVSVCLGLLCGLTWVYWKGVTKALAVIESSRKERGPFSITQGAAWIAPNFFNGFYWVHFTGSNTITPINIMAFYTITNLKTTTSRISNLSLEMSGAGGEWYGLDNLTTHQEIWAADMQHPTSVAAITLPEGFLMDKIANRNLAPGEPVMGWMLCQIPASYIPSGNNYARIRLRVEDTATDQKVQDFDIPQTSANVLSTEMQGRAAPGVDIRDYKIVPEGAFKPLVEK